MFKSLFLHLTMLLVTTGGLGCARPMRVTHELAPPPESIRLTGKGLHVDYTAMLPEESILLQAVVDELLRSRTFAEVASPGEKAESMADYSLDLSIRVRKAGYSGNFFVSWPGYYIFMPVWHGYKYRHHIDLQGELVETSSRRRVPVVSNETVRIRHSAINRTWVQAGWLWLWPLWDIAAIVNGGISRGYDDRITEEALRRYDRDYGAAIRGRILLAVAELDGMEGAP